MNRRGRLRRLDDDWVPVAGARLQRLAATLRRHARALRSVGRVVEEQPALSASIAAVLVAALLIGVAGHDAGGREGPPPVEVIATEPPALVATIGPLPGSSVATYLTRAAYDLRHFGEIAAGRPTYAIIDLSRFETPAQALATFDGVAVVRAYVQVRSRLPTQMRSIPLTHPGDLLTGMRTSAVVASATARSYAALVNGLHPTSRADRKVRDRYAAVQRAAELEAARLSHPARCRCVFAMVVRADVARLAALARRGEVRVVDPASPVIPLTGLTVLPLSPDVTTVLPLVGLPSG